MVPSVPASSTRHLFDNKNETVRPLRVGGDRRRLMRKRYFVHGDAHVPMSSRSELKSSCKLSLFCHHYPTTAWQQPINPGCGEISNGSKRTTHRKGVVLTDRGECRLSREILKPASDEGTAAAGESRSMSSLRGIYYGDTVAATGYVSRISKFRFQFRRPQRERFPMCHGHPLLSAHHPDPRVGRGLWVAPAPK